MLYEDKARQDFIFTIYHWWQAVAIFIVYEWSELPMKVREESGTERNSHVLKGLLRSFGRVQDMGLV